MTLVHSIGVLATALVLAGCGFGGGDAAAPSSSAQATSSTSVIPSMTPAPPRTTPATGKPLAFKDYLASINVTGEPVHLDKAPGLAVTVPVPDGWAQTSDPLFSTGVEFVQPVGAAGSFPSATLMAIRLVGDFDPKDAIRHANSDALAPTATNVSESFDDYDGFPSAATQGISGGDEHFSRIVLADVPSTSERYLVQLTATTPADQPIAQSSPVKDVVSGFKVAVS
ncbi:MAG TPA: LpqN/LpqT family lipoprotein [Mycobacterium sp.]|nr:LpqN/LpqT family lipoprotein [Mycobacterium sp.]